LCGLWRWRLPDDVGVVNDVSIGGLFAERRFG